MDKPLNLKVAIVGLGYHPHVPIIRPTREHPHWAGARSVAGDRATVAGFDVVVVATAPAGVNYREVADWVPRIVETRNAMAAVQVAPGKVWKA
jgi:UDP-N-acetyl-D-glucosamine dehydrogenase